MTEIELAPIICSLPFGGVSEAQLVYVVGGDDHKVRVDCLTSSHAIEIGLDKRSSIDSVHQTIFAAYMAGLEPMVVIIDTDGRIDQNEYQVKTVSEGLGIKYQVYDESYLIRWRMTQYLRNQDKLHGPVPKEKGD